MMPTFHKWLSRILTVAQLFLLLATFTSWSYITTLRLYVEDGANPADFGMVWQQFVIRNKQVVPEILTEGNTHLKFHLRLPRRATMWISAEPSGTASYEVYLSQNAARQLIAKRELRAAALDAVSLPAGDSMLEIASNGALMWSDLRIVTRSRVAIYGSLFVILCGIRIAAGRHRRSRSIVNDDRRWRAVSRPAGLILASCFLTLAAFEGAIRIAGAPAPILTLRRDLGEAGPDPHWEHSSRYGARLRPNLDTPLHWEDGDIARMGFIPLSPFPKTSYRYPLHTDSEGFRNAEVRPDIHVAALGDSFTDALTLPAEQIWTAQLEGELGLPVQNYGTAGFGPQQELRVLTDYAMQHGPRVVLLAFFAGNDIFNAESFDQFDKSGILPPPAGWKIKKVFARYETLYSFTLAGFAMDTIARLAARGKTIDSARGKSSAGTPPGREERNADLNSGPAFDHGQFTIPAGGSTLRFALMPPYLQTLNYSRAALEKRAGWRLTREAILQMNRAARAGGAKLAVVFIPFKAQVYLPVLGRSLPAAELEKAFRYYFRQQATPFDLNEMFTNRLAQNELMQKFCDEAGIPLLDLTSVLQMKTEAGHDMYFRDDAHWNAEGHRLAAVEITAFMRRERLDGGGQKGLRP